MDQQGYMIAFLSGVNIRGFRFQPTELELMEYLEEHETGLGVNPILIPQVDINNVPPSDFPNKCQNQLPGEKSEYYLLHHSCKKYPTSPREDRQCTVGGFWKATGRPTHIKNKNREVIGERRTLVFYMGKAGNRGGAGSSEGGKKTDWIMHEFRRVNFAASPRTPTWVVCSVTCKPGSASPASPTKAPGPASPSSPTSVGAFSSPDRGVTLCESPGQQYVLPGFAQQSMDDVTGLTMLQLPGTEDFYNCVGFSTDYSGATPPTLRRQNQFPASYNQCNPSPANPYEEIFEPIDTDASMHQRREMDTVPSFEKWRNEVIQDNMDVESNGSVGLVENNTYDIFGNHTPSPLYDSGAQYAAYQILG